MFRKKKADGGVASAASSGSSDTAPSAQAPSPRHSARQVVQAAVASGAAEGGPSSINVAVKLAARVEELEDALRRRDEEHIVMKGDLAEARDILKQQSRDANMAEAEKATVDKELADATKRQSATREELRACQAELTALQASSDSLAQALKDSDAELEKNKAYFFEQMERWEAQAQAKDKEMALAKEKLEAKGKENEAAGAGAGAGAGTAAAHGSPVEAEEAAALKKEVRLLEKQKEELERQMVELTGLSIMNSELTEAKESSSAMAEKLEAERGNAQQLSTSLKEAQDDLRAAEEILESTLAAEASKREQLQQKLDAVAEDAEAALKDKGNEAELMLLSLRKAQQELADTKEELGDLTSSASEQRAQFERQESQRLAALDGQTAALLVAEREKVQAEEQQKAEVEITQLIADQRQAMEAIVKAVRAEEEMKHAAQLREVRRTKSSGAVLKAGKDSETQAPTAASSSSWSSFSLFGSSTSSSASSTKTTPPSAAAANEEQTPDPGPGPTRPPANSDHESLKSMSL